MDEVRDDQVEICVSLTYAMQLYLRNLSTPNEALFYEETQCLPPLPQSVQSDISSQRDRGGSS